MINLNLPTPANKGSKNGSINETTSSEADITTSRRNKEAETNIWMNCSKEYTMKKQQEQANEQKQKSRSRLNKPKVNENHPGDTEIGVEIMQLVYGIIKIFTTPLVWSHDRQTTPFACMRPFTLATARTIQPVSYILD